MFSSYYKVIIRYMQHWYILNMKLHAILIWFFIHIYFSGLITFKYFNCLIYLNISKNNYIMNNGAGNNLESNFKSQLFYLSLKANDTPEFSWCELILYIFK